MKQTRRSRQVSELMRDEIARIIRHELNDPDLAMATITQVEVSPDLRYARVWLSAIGEEPERNAAFAAAERATGRGRHELARSRAFRWVPELDWRLDTSAVYASHIESKLREVLPQEKEVLPQEKEETNDDDDR